MSGKSGDTLRFSVVWLRENGKILLEETGWRLRASRVMPPATLFKGRFIETVLPAKDVIETLEEMLCDWEKDFPSVEFPSLPPRTHQDQSESVG